MAGQVGKSGRRTKLVGPVEKLCTRPIISAEPIPVEPDWIRTKSDQCAADNGAWFVYEQGDYVCRWIERYCTISEGYLSGKPFKLMEWQRDIVMQLFGWFRFDEEMHVVVRRFRRAFIEIPKKNGKSPLAAAIALYLAFGDNEQIGNLVGVIATDMKQAENVCKHVLRMVGAKQALSTQIAVNLSLYRAQHLTNFSEVKSYAYNPTQLEGQGFSAVICDELHAWRLHSHLVMDAIRYGGAARLDFLLLAITTAGDDIETLCHDQYEYAKGVLDGSTIDEEILCVIYEAARDADWTDPEVWRAANPSMGTILRMAELESACQQAQASPRVQNAFKRYRLNMWTQSEQSWLDLEHWKLCSDSQGDWALLDGCQCYAGLDLAKTRDISALVLMFHMEDENKYYQIPHFFMPEEQAKERNKTQPYLAWADEGHLHLAPGDVMDYGYIFEQIAILAEQYTIEAVAYDPWNAEHLSQQIEDEIGIQRVAFQQNMGSFNAPTKEYERRIVDHTLLHPGNPLLTWQASHVMIKEDQNGNIRPIKRYPDSSKSVDGIVAGIMALAQSLVGDERPSYYEHNQLEAF